MGLMRLRVLLCAGVWDRQVPSTARRNPLLLVSCSEMLLQSFPGTVCGQDLAQPASQEPSPHTPFGQPPGCTLRGRHRPGGARPALTTQSRWLSLPLSAGAAVGLDRRARVSFPGRRHAGAGQAPDQLQPQAGPELPLDPAKPLGRGYQAGESVGPRVVLQCCVSEAPLYQRLSCASSDVLVPLPVPVSCGLGRRWRCWLREPLGACPGAGRWLASFPSEGAAVGAAVEAVVPTGPSGSWREGDPELCSRVALPALCRLLMRSPSAAAASRCRLVPDAAWKLFGLACNRP